MLRYLRPTRRGGSVDSSRTALPASGLQLCRCSERAVRYAAVAVAPVGLGKERFLVGLGLYALATGGGGGMVQRLQIQPFLRYMFIAALELRVVALALRVVRCQAAARAV